MPLAKLDVRSRPTAPQHRAVHHVVLQQRERVQQLEAGRGSDRAWVVARPAQPAQIRERRTQTLSTGDELPQHIFRDIHAGTAQLGGTPDGDEIRDMGHHAALHARSPRVEWIRFCERLRESARVTTPLENRNPSTFSTPVALRTTRVIKSERRGHRSSSGLMSLLLHQIRNQIRTQHRLQRPGATAGYAVSVAARPRRPVFPNHARRRDLANQPDGQRAGDRPDHQVGARSGRVRGVGRGRGGIRGRPAGAARWRRRLERFLPGGADDRGGARQGAASPAGPHRAGARGVDPGGARATGGRCRLVSVLAGAGDEVRRSGARPRSSAHAGPPRAEVWRRIPSWEFHRANVDPGRARTIVGCAQRASSLERLTGATRRQRARR